MTFDLSIYGTPSDGASIVTSDAVDSDQNGVGSWTVTEPLEEDTAPRRCVCRR